MEDEAKITDEHRREQEPKKPSPAQMRVLQSLYKGREIFVLESVDESYCNVGIAMVDLPDMGIQAGQIIRRGDGRPPNCIMAQLDLIRWGTVNSTRTFEEICAGPPR